MPNYLSDSRPQFKRQTIQCGQIRAYVYERNLETELKEGTLSKPEALNLLEDMLTVREFEEMIVKLRSGAYPACAGFDYRGPTHVSIGQEAASVGGIAGIAADDYITSTHRGHGDSIAKGCVAIRAMNVEQLRLRVPHSPAKDRKALVEEALEDHVYRTIAELFGKEDGYCKGRGGGMHIADFTVGHLGANAIVGGGVPIATGAAMGARYLRNGRSRLLLCRRRRLRQRRGARVAELGLHGPVHQPPGRQGPPFGLPIVYRDREQPLRHDRPRPTTRSWASRSLARRAAGFADNNMHAEVVNGMDVLAVRDAVRRAAAGLPPGQGTLPARGRHLPLLRPFAERPAQRVPDHARRKPPGRRSTRSRPSPRQLLAAKVLGPKALDALRQKVADRNARAAGRAARPPTPIRPT